MGTPNPRLHFGAWGGPELSLGMQSTSQHLPTTTCCLQFPFSCSCSTQASCCVAAPQQTSILQPAAAAGCCSFSTRLEFSSTEQGDFSPSPGQPWCHCSALLSWMKCPAMQRLAHCTEASHQLCNPLMPAGGSCLVPAARQHLPSSCLPLPWPELKFASLFSLIFSNLPPCASKLSSQDPSLPHFTSGKGTGGL